MRNSKRKQEIAEIKKKHRQEQDQKKEVDKKGDTWSKMKSLIDLNKNGSKDTQRMKNCLKAKFEDRK